MADITLPIAAKRDEILATIHDNPVTIIVTETGAGKTTQVPQYLLDAGHNLIVTQPRRLAARNVAARVAAEYGTPFGDAVGYRTADERKDSGSTRCLFLTDGLALMRELVGAGKHDVIVIDEVHEWNINIEVLVAWCRDQLAKGATFKLVLMSATLEIDALREYFAGAPVIQVEGRTFPITNQEPSGSMLDDIVALLRLGRHVLNFQPGQGEIRSMMGGLQDLVDRGQLLANILPLYGELSREEQDACFVSPIMPTCVVSTNVAETSLTVPYIDAVVDSGMERRTEVRDGVEGLHLLPISLANAKQRQGRAGRTKPGIYIDHCPQIYGRLEFPVAEILRTRLDQTVLRLAEAGLDAEKLEFFHQPSKSDIHDARRALYALGCMTEDGVVTPMGRRIAKMPISVQYGRMIVEAEKRGVLADILDIAAILEQQGIVARKVEIQKGITVPAFTIWRREFCPDESTSDVLAQLAVYRAARDLSSTEMKQKGIFGKSYHEARRLRKLLADALKGKVKSITSTGKREDILLSLCAGMVDHLYFNRGSGWINGDSTVRDLNQESVISDRLSDWIVGKPWDLSFSLRDGGTGTRKLIQFATKVQPEWLMEVAPHLVQTIEGALAFDEGLGRVGRLVSTQFNGQRISDEIVSTTPSPDTTLVLALAMAQGKVSYRGDQRNQSQLAMLSSLMRYRSDFKEQYSPVNLAADMVAIIRQHTQDDLVDLTGLEDVDFSLDLLAGLSDTDRREALRYEPQTYTIQGFDVSLTFEPGWMGMKAVASLTKEALLTIPDLSYIGDHLVMNFQVVDDSGRVVDSGSSSQLKYHYEQEAAAELRRETQAPFYSQISGLEATMRGLMQNGRPVAELQGLIDKANYAVSRLHAESWNNPSTTEQVRSAITAVQREIDRLSQGGNQVLLDDLLAGKLIHHSQQLNAQVREKLDEYAIRTGGYISRITDEMLIEHYRQRLEGISRVDEFHTADLDLHLSEYLDLELIDIAIELGELELAPGSITLPTRKDKTQDYVLTYRYTEALQDAESVPAAYVQVSLNVYKTNGWEHGKQSAFPRLPHGIRLIIEVTEQNKVIATGEDGENLRKRVQKYEKGKARGANVPSEDEFGLRRRSPFQATPPPPWLVR